MEFLSLLPVLMFFIFIAVIVLNIRKGLKKFAERTRQADEDSIRSYPKDKPGKKPGWTEVLGDAISQVQKQLEAARQQQERQRKSLKRKTGEQRLAKKRGDGKPEADSPVSLVWEKNAPVSAPPPLPSGKKKEERESPRRSTRTRQPRREPEPLREKDGMQAESPFELKTTREELRKAIIWSEILARPLALRKEREEL
jgi:hypothetical protein